MLGGTDAYMQSPSEDIYVNGTIFGPSLSILILYWRYSPG